MRSFIIASAFAALVTSLLESPACAQAAPAADAASFQVGSILGRLTLPAGAKTLAGVTVKIAETGATATVSGRGEFEFHALPPGTYTLEAAGADYSRLKITGVIVRPDQKTAVLEEMPRVVHQGVVDTAAESAVEANSAIEKLSNFVVSEVKAPPFSDANLDIPRGPDDIQPYYIITGDTLENSGAQNVETYLKDYLTQDSTFETNSQIRSNNSAQGQEGNVSGITLRGIGSLSTLILVDGQRLPSVSLKASTLSQANINEIPPGAIDRIEVMPSSASAIYGSSAVGGVINIVLKKDYQGGEVTTSYNTYTGGKAPQYSVNLLYGFNLGEKTHITLDAEYLDARPLTWQDRTFISDYLARAVHNFPSAYYGTNSAYVYGATPNIALNTAAVNGFTNPAGSTNLTLKNGTSLGSPITFISPGTAPGTATATLNSSLLANAGAQNLNVGPGAQVGLSTDVLNVDRISSVLLGFNHKFNRTFTLFGDISHYEQMNVGENLDDLANGAWAFAVPGNAPTNPFQQNVFVTIPTPASENGINRTKNEITAVTIGLLTKLPGDWKLDTSFIYDVNMQSFYYSLMNLANTTTFGGDAGLLYTGQLNPFVDTVAFPTHANAYYGYWHGWGRTSLGDFNIRASGSLFALPGGRPTLTVGLESRSENDFPEMITVVAPGFPAVPPATVNPTNEYSNFQGQRLVTQSGYTEVLVPVISSKNHVRLVDQLDIQAAVRSERFVIDTNQIRYNGFPNANPPTYAPTTTPGVAKTTFTATQPTFGLKYKPVDSLIFRASYSTAFLPPAFAQLQPTVNPTLTTTAAFFDPVTNQTYTSLRTPAEGNPNLKPQSARAWNAGVIWEPTTGLLRDFRFNLEFFKIFQDNLIAQPASAQIIASTPGLANLVTRDPATNKITLMTFEYANVGNAYTDGWDASASYRKETPIGTFGFRAAATITEHLKQPPAVGNVQVEYVGYVREGGVDKIKANANLTWSPLNSRLALGWTTRYYGSYKQIGAPSDPEYLGAAVYTPIITNTAPQGGNTIPSQMYHNIFARYAFGENGRWHGLLNRVSVQLGINDLFNTAPPFDAYSGGAPFFYSRFGPVGLREYTLTVKKAF